MADLKRGERIKLLREERHMTQPAVADAIGITLRAYQKYETGGGLKWDNAVALAKVFQVQTSDIMGKPGTPPAPYGLPSAQLDSIEAKLDQILETLTRRGAAETPSPPGELGRRVRATPPTKPGQLQPKTRKVADGRKGSAG